MNKPVNHHLVSAGYQRNFGDDEHFLTIIAARDGQLLRRRQAIKSNWTAANWNSVVDPSKGRADTRLEAEFARIESTALHTVRNVRIGRLDDQGRGAIIELFAMHLARSEPFRTWEREIAADFLPKRIQGLGEKSHLVESFTRQSGRLPRPGEIEAAARQLTDEKDTTNEWRVESTANHYNAAAEKLSTFAIQIVEVDDRLPGLPIGDVPIVHAHLGRHLFGYRDRLAIGDADLICGPLTRRVLVCLTAVQQPHATIRTKAKLNQVVSLFARAAVREIACHPEDALHVQRVCRSPPPLRRP